MVIFQDPYAMDTGQRDKSNGAITDLPLFPLQTMMVTAVSAASHEAVLLLVCYPGTEEQFLTPSSYNGPHPMGQGSDLGTPQGATYVYSNDLFWNWGNSDMIQAC